ncbi:ATP-binding protein [Nocardia stercoris]|uniref:histidine kinase n=1 Tax=Nocardia stercoris TaxID=2483361 RepID=A0A3M2LD11_9NOCA|nr:ATP-binding protein [Nocardia stercoris]RMI35419.1 ATP-binding protein [Nocardia stercoris]
MTLGIFPVLFVLTLILSVAVSVLLYFAIQQRNRANSELRSSTLDLERLLGSTMPAVQEAVSRPDGQLPQLPPPSSQDRTARLIREVAERYTNDLRRMQAETRDRVRRSTEHEAQQAVARARAEARAEAAGAARDATGAAVRSFGTSVVSLGTDVGQIVSAALRTHRGDEVYETLTSIDHSVQQMIRQAQSYVIVCGGLPGRRWPAQSFTDVVAGATGRVRDFTRVRSAQLDRTVLSRTVEPLVHTVATLLDNALRYSPPGAFVDVTFQEGHHGITVIVDDAGLRMNAEQLEEARQLLSGERSVDLHQMGPSPRLGFPAIAALARRYGFSIGIDGPNAYGGMRATVFVPDRLLAESAAPAPAPGSASEQQAVPVQAVSEARPVTDLTHTTASGLPRRRRRELPPEVPATAPPPADSAAPPSPNTLIAWHTGSRSGRAAATAPSEGMDPR